MRRSGGRYRGCGRLGAAALASLVLSPAAADAQLQAERWNFSASLSALYSDDIFFVGEGGPDDAIATGALGLGWARVSERTRLSLSGFVSYRKYADLDAFDGGLGTIGGAASHAFTPRFRGSVSYGYSQGISALGRGLGQVVLPDVDISTQVGSASLDFDMTPRTTATLSGSLTRFDYTSERRFEGSLLPFVAENPELADFGLEPGEDGQPIVTDPFLLTQQLLATVAVAGVSRRSLTIDTYRAGLGLSHSFSERTNGSLNAGWSGVRSEGADLQPGGLLDAGAGLGHSLGERWDLSLSYAFSRNGAQRPAVDTHNALVGVGARLSSRVNLDTAIGVGFFETAETTSRSLIGSLSLSGRMDRSTWSLSYNRSQISALALGRSFVTDFANASWAHVFSKKLTGSVYAAYQNSRDPLADYTYDTLVLGLSLSRRIHERTALSATYSFRRLGLEDLPAIQGSMLAISLRYGRIWK